MGYRLTELAERFKLELDGDAGIVVDGVGSLKSGQAGQLGFLAESRYSGDLAGSRLSAVILRSSDRPAWAGAALISKNPQADFARIAGLFDPIQRPPAGIHPTAWVSEGAELADGVAVGPRAIVESGARIGADTVIGPGCYVGEHVTVGEESWLTANVTLYHRVTLGARVHAQPGSVVGGRGFGLAPENGHWVEVPQLGSVIIGDDVEIGANTCIDRGALGDTVIGDGVKLDNLVQVGHNTRIGEHTAIAGCVGIAGSCEIGARCQIGGAAGILGHLRIADDVVVTAFSLVSSSIETAGLYSASLPVAPAREWRRQVARLRNIDDLAKRVKNLEKDQG